MTRKPLLVALMGSLLTLANSGSSFADEVVAFWHFADNYSFPDDANKYDFAAEVDGTIGGNAMLQAFLGNADEFDSNGGGGFVSYTSPTSGLTYAPSRTIKWDDLRGGGDTFDIGGVTDFTLRVDSSTTEQIDFGNDALLYFTMDTTGFDDLRLRFDIEATPGDLPDTFDLYYRVGGSGEWFRDADQNNIDLAFQDYNTPDPDNQFADSGLIGLSSTLNNQSFIEVILNDFDRNGNGEMEIDNIEFIGSLTAIPEPSSIPILLLTACAATTRFRPRRRRSARD